MTVESTMENAAATPDVNVPVSLALPSGANAGEEVIVNPDPELLEPLEGRVLLKKMSVESKAKSGLILPEKAQVGKGTCYARVVKAHTHRLAQDGVTRIPMTVKTGMIVLINEYGGLPVGRTETHVIMSEIEVLGIHTEPAGKGSAAMQSFSNNPRAIA